MELYLDDRNVPFAHYAVDFFDEDMAKDFVVRYLNVRLGNETTTRSQPFVKARDEIFKGIKKAVSNGSDQADLARSVLGYAPVLEAVSEYLSEEDNRKNYFRLLRALEHKSREWELLLQVAEALLDREHRSRSQQFKERMSAAAPLGWSDWDRLYSAEEQAQRLLASRFKLPQPRIPSELPVTLRDEYERAVETALREHPFRGSVDGFHPIFGEYLYARLLTSKHAPGSSIVAQARDQLRAGSYLPTRALGRFMHALSTRVGQASISSRDFGFAYESALSDQQKPGDVSLVLLSNGGADEHRAWLNVGKRPIEFKIEEVAQGIWFWRRLNYASVAVACDVELGFAGGEFRLGPAVNIDCLNFRCPAELLVYAGNEKEGSEVALVANNFEEVARAPAVHGKRFYVHGQNVPWPWSDYHEAGAKSPEATPEVVAAYNHLARILLWFRAMGHDEKGRIDDLVESFATGGTQAGRDLLGFCVEKKLILRGKLYTLNDEELTRYGINYVDLARRTLRAPVIKLLSEFLAR